MHGTGCNRLVVNTSKMCMPLPMGTNTILTFLNDQFINHCQRSGQDQARMLNELLTKEGATVWYDMESVRNVLTHALEY